MDDYLCLWMDEIISTYMDDYLCLWMDETNSLFIDGYQEQLWIVWVCCLLHLEECGPEGGPTVDHLEEGDLGLLRRHPGVLVVRLHDLTLPVLRGLNPQHVL